MPVRILPKSGSHVYFSVACICDLTSTTCTVTCCNMPGSVPARGHWGTRVPGHHYPNSTSRHPDWEKKRPGDSELEFDYQSPPPPPPHTHTYKDTP